MWYSRPKTYLWPWVQWVNTGLHSPTSSWTNAPPSGHDWKQHITHEKAKAEYLRTISMSISKDWTSINYIDIGRMILTKFAFFFCMWHYALFTQTWKHEMWHDIQTGEKLKEKPKSMNEETLQVQMLLDKCTAWYN